MGPGLGGRHQALEGLPLAGEEDGGQDRGALAGVAAIIIIIIMIIIMIIIIIIIMFMCYCYYHYYYQHYV